MGAANFDLLGEQSLFSIGGRFGGFGETSVKVFPEALEGQFFVFHTPLSRGEEVVASNTIYPGRKGAFATETAEASNDPHKDFLGGVFRILRMPKHP
ncbi:MAG: hypothetical protein L0387_14630 [Acidobacteria bacterium]|nr:hypothetical protein [Acidobacteriota bacterium]MCI0718014.1 hypothetical protein [Acidobacteriota bacterium]